MIRDVAAIADDATLAGWLNQLDTGLRPMIARNLKTTSVPFFALATTIAVRKALSHEVPWASA